MVDLKQEGLFSKDTQLKKALLLQPCALEPSHRGCFFSFVKVDANYVPEGSMKYNLFSSMTLQLFENPGLR